MKATLLFWAGVLVVWAIIRYWLNRRHQRKVCQRLAWDSLLSRSQAQIDSLRRRHAEVDDWLKPDWDELLVQARAHHHYLEEQRDRT